MQWTAWTTLATLTMYFWVFVKAGKARATFKVKAPSMEGPLEFQSIFRVHANTVEQIVMFLPALWLCAFYLNDRLAALGGFIWITGRIMYALAYYKDPAKRSLGFAVALTANALLMAGAMIGLIMHPALL